MIKASLSLIRQEVKIISPKIRLHWDMRRTTVGLFVFPAENGFNKGRIMLSRSDDGNGIFWIWFQSNIQANFNHLNNG